MPRRTVTVKTADSEITAEWSSSDFGPYTALLSVGDLRGSSRGTDLPDDGWDWKVRDGDTVVAEGHARFGHDARRCIETEIARRLGGTAEGVTVVGRTRIPGKRSS